MHPTLPFAILLLKGNSSRLGNVSLRQSSLTRKCLAIGKRPKNLHVTYAHAM